jgi:hypothetical protein
MPLVVDARLPATIFRRPPSSPDRVPSDMDAQLAGGTRLAVSTVQEKSLMRHTTLGQVRQIVGRAICGLVLAAVLVGVTGTGCDQSARASFREAAVGPIGDGVRSAMNGVLDGVIAAITNAGDSSSSSSTSSASKTTGT